MSGGFTHFDQAGNAAMVDVSAKPETERDATARARVVMQPATLAMIQAGTAKKGDVLGVARLAGIMAAKRTAELIPLCHPLPLSAVTVDLIADPNANARRDRRHGAHHRPHRRRDGGADRRARRRADRLRHVQGGRSVDADRRHCVSRTRRAASQANFRRTDNEPRPGPPSGCTNRVAQLCRPGVSSSFRVSPRTPQSVIPGEALPLAKAERPGTHDLQCCARENRGSPTRRAGGINRGEAVTRHRRTRSDTSDDISSAACGTTAASTGDPGLQPVVYFNMASATAASMAASSTSISAISVSPIPGSLVPWSATERHRSPDPRGPPSRRRLQQSRRRRWRIEPSVQVCGTGEVHAC